MGDQSLYFGGSKISILLEREGKNLGIVGSLNESSYLKAAQRKFILLWVFEKGPKKK